MVTTSHEDSSDTAAPESALRVGRWPVGVLIVAILRIIDAVSMFAIGVGVKDLPVDALPILADSPMLTRGLDIVLATATIIGVIGLLAFRRWGWVVTMILVGVGLLAELIRVVIGQPDHLGLLLLVVSAFYLNQRSVRVMAGRHLDPAVSTSG
ncbi:MAG: hypothetical protein K0S97_1406 [Chloroflexota bacterium]|jgi:hypothetical protein|nr:hypothetical protein [Chloroflexota bacterium]